MRKDMTQEVANDIIPITFIAGAMLGAGMALFGYNLALYARRRAYEREMKAHVEKQAVVQVPKGRAFDRLLKQLLQGK